MRKTWRFLAALGVLIGTAAPLQAQTITRTLAWTHQNDALTAVNGYTFTLKIDAAAPVKITSTCQTSATVLANVDCTAPVTLASGDHDITVTASNAGGSASGTLHYVQPAGPTMPASVKITIQITVP